MGMHAVAKHFYKLLCLYFKLINSCPDQIKENNHLSSGSSTLMHVIVGPLNYGNTWWYHLKLLPFLVRNQILVQEYIMECIGIRVNQKLALHLSSEKFRGITQAVILK